MATRARTDDVPAAYRRAEEQLAIERAIRALASRRFSEAAAHYETALGHASRRGDHELVRALDGLVRALRARF